MTKKVIYFTAGAVATSAELAAIAAIKAYTEPLLELNVGNGAVAQNLGSDDNGDPNIQVSDYVAGTIPANYNAVDQLDPDDIGPSLDVGADKAVVTDAQVITIGAQTFTFTIADGVITAIAVGAV